MPLLLLYTDKRGRSEEPDRRFLIPRLMRSLRDTFVPAMMNYFLAADLPALRRNCSPANLIPFPLYGSGARNERILAATCPSNCLSIDSRVMVGFLPFSAVVDTLTSLGRINTTWCENPRVRSNVLPCALARYPTPTNSWVVL